MPLKNSDKLNTQQQNHVMEIIQRLGQTRTHNSVSEKGNLRIFQIRGAKLISDIKMVVNACRNEKLEFEGEIVKIKTFEKKSKQARNKVSLILLSQCETQG